MRISHHLVPPLGWIYRQDGIILREQTFDDLVKLLLSHRKENNIAIGDPIQDIEDQIADEYPNFIINGDLKKKFMGVSFFHTVQSFAQFLLNWALSGGQLVDQNTANLRAEICKACHNNKPSSEVRQGCSTCNKMGSLVINSVRSKIIGKHSTPSDNKILTCGICGCDNKISVWIPNEILLSPEEANAFPTFCWKKARLENRNL